MITIENLHKEFDGLKVLKGLNLEIRDGETLVIIGRSGCGKSVLLKNIIGILSPDQGEVIVDSQHVSKLKGKDLVKLRMKFGMLFQSAALFDSMTVEENVSLALREHTDQPEDEIRYRVQEKLRVVGLPGTEDKKPAELSGGMKKRVGLARALIMDPKFVLFDEPTTGLDPITARKIDDLIKETHDQLEITSVLVTHDMASAFHVGDRIAMLSDGEIVFDGTPDAFQNSTRDIVRQFNDGRLSRPSE